MASLTLLVGAASATAAVRHAAPGGTGKDPCANPGDPCSIFTAAHQEAPGTTIAAGDEVIMQPGTYTSSPIETGFGLINLPHEIELHGIAGQPRPRLEVGLIVGFKDVVSHIEVDPTDPGKLNLALAMDGGLVEDAIVRMSGNATIGTPACNAAGGVLRDSVCLSNTRRGMAVSIGMVAPTLQANLVLRNVTAIATGEKSFGLSSTVIGNEGSPTVNVDAKGVIARGTERDVVAEGLAKKPDQAGTGGNVDIRLDHSNYATTRTVTDAGGGTATISPTGPGTTNIASAPRLAADGYHQLPNSPTVDSGITDALSGGFDIDGLLRTFGPAADIGADELGPPTTTTLVCAPDGPLLGTQSTCVATVANAPGGGPGAPSGFVEFRRQGEGELSAASCQLATNQGVTSCQVSYTPFRAGAHTVAATYLGNTTHDPSQGNDELIAIANNRTTTTNVVCVPDTLLLGIQASCVATVANALPTNPNAPGGTVRFSRQGEGQLSAASCQLVTNQGVTSCQVGYTPARVGAHKITASYQGDNTHDPSERDVELIAITHPTRTSVVCTPGSVLPGEVSTCVATVENALAGTPSPPSGTVAFRRQGEGEFSRETCNLVISQGVTSCQVEYRPFTARDHLITATYLGDTTHALSDGVNAVVATGNTTTTTLDCTPTTLRIGLDTPTCTATVVDTSADDPSVPRGEVRFVNDSPGAPGGFSFAGNCIPVDAGGFAATCKVAFSAAIASRLGTREIIAFYVPEVGHLDSQDDAELQVIQPPIPPLGQPPIPPVGQPPVTQPPRIAAPNTSLKSKPRKKTVKPSARFTFASNQPGSTFACKLDKSPFRPCRSPFKRNVKPGRHTFEVRAINAGGVADPTPAVFSWKVGQR